MADKKEARITVDPDLFRQGLKAAYEGISLIYKSLGVASAHGLKNDESINGSSSPVAKDSNQKTASSDPEKKKEAPILTQDDVTKIIVRKIKQDRSNNEKIGQILKTYGVAKVGELPPAKYEAFVTDIAAL